ncbi:MAG: hypothetical protein HWE21_04800 [Cytophagia bacterium]|nr:hypothetical protein [Cytophagia bacterium]
MNLFYVYQIEVTGNYTGVRTTGDHLTVGLPWIVPAFIFSIIQFRRLNFKRIEVRLNPEQFKEIALAVGNDMNWRIKNLTKDYVVANTGFSLFSWGERITIIRAETEILINSICDPDNRPSVVSMGQNRANMMAFKNKIAEVMSPQIVNPTS